MTTELDAIAFKAQTHPKHRFQNLYGQLKEGVLYRAWANLNKKSAAGIDGVYALDYEKHLPENINALTQRLKEGTYRANDVKRVYIPKANGKQRPLGLPTIEDKIVQQGVTEILQSIWEQDFKRFSYGYRPNKSPHQAMRSLQMNLQYGRYGYVVEADIKGFFDNMDHHWLMDMLRQRIDDNRLLNLINQWLKARVVEPDGQYHRPSKGTPQGGVISAMLANIYLHYALDLWFDKVVKPSLRGQAMLIRYADDFLVAFQYQDEAQQFYSSLADRLGKFGLDIAPEKTSMKRFNRFHPSQQRNFNFLGFKFYWDWDFKGEYRLRMRTSPKKHKAILASYYQWIKENRHKRLNYLIPKLSTKVRGLLNYFSLTDNGKSVNDIYSHILRSLHKWLNRRSQRRSFTWSGMKSMLNHFGFPPLRIRKSRVAFEWYD